jgi:hypothetical protein
LYTNKLYDTKWKNFWRHILLKLAQKEIEALNKSLASKQIEFIKKNTKKQNNANLPSPLNTYKNTHSLPNKEMSRTRWLFW